MDELPDCIVEIVRVTVEIHIQISKLVEDELFSLSVLKEKESNKVLIGKLYQLLSSKTRTVIMLFLAKVVLEHELVHGSVKSYCLVSLSLKFIFVFEDFD